MQAVQCVPNFWYLYQAAQCHIPKDNSLDMQNVPGLDTHVHRQV